MAPIFLFVNKPSAAAETADIRVLLAITRWSPLGLGSWCPLKVVDLPGNSAPHFFHSHIYFDCTGGLAQEPLLVKHK